MSGDIIHHGHINILKIASSYGNVILGALTDKAIKSYKKKPITNYKQRKLIFDSIKYVKKVIPQSTHDYSNNLRKIKPNYVIHGNDWKKVLKNMLEKKLFY